MVYYSEKDAAALPLDNLPGHPMVAALLDSLQSASTGYLQERMRGIFARLRNLREDPRIKPWVTALTRYYGAIRGAARSVKDELADAYTGLYGEQEAGKMAMSMLEQILTEGEARGIAKGRVEGRVEGKAIGHAEGKIESIVTFLELRFGEIPDSIKMKLTGLTDVRRIDEMLKAAATCASLKEFKDAL